MTYRSKSLLMFCMAVLLALASALEWKASFWPALFFALAAICCMISAVMHMTKKK